MSASKKTTNKSTKSPAPAIKETKTAVKTVTKKTPAKTTAAKEQAVATAGIVAAVARAAAPVLAAAAAAPKAAVKQVAASSVRTTIAAKIDVGFGNTLFVRGEGPGLSWDQGRPMTNVGADGWQIQLGEASRPFVFKFLVNDVTWSTGADYTVAPGASSTFSPEF